MEQTTLDPKIIDRINKLLALANDGAATENEAEVAMTKAQELMEANNLSMAQIEAEGGTAEKRTREETHRKAMYAFQRDLMMALAEVNYCYCEVIYGAAIRRRVVKEQEKGNEDVTVYDVYENDPGKRTVPKGYRIIGRQSNVISVTVMFDYLIKTMNRLVSHSEHHNMSRWAMSFKEGCSVRLQQRLKERHERMLKEQKEEAERKQKEYETRSKHPGAAPSTGTALVVLLVDHEERERELNNDYRMGWEPGTTIRKRLEREALEKKRRADAIAQGITDENILYWIDFGYSIERATQIAYPQPRLEDEPKKRKREETERQRRIREEREARANERWWRRQERKESRRDLAGFQAGKAAGEKIGLDTQIGNQGSKKLR